MRTWLSSLGCLYVIFMYAVPPAATSCPSVNTAVNCSFESGDSCLKAYRTYDQHGLKWAPQYGAIEEHVTVQGPYGYAEYRSNVFLESSPKDWYLHVPATQDPRALGLWTDLVSPPLTIDRQGCLYFLFHNNVCGQQTDPGDIHFKVLLQHFSDVQGLTHTGTRVLREYPCIDDERWYRAQIPIHNLSGVFRIVFAAKQHDIENKSIAVDHVMYSDQSCSIREDDNFKEGDCDFEDADLCGYRETRSGNETTPLVWQAVQGDMFPEAQNATVEAPAGYFVCLWGRDDRASGDVVTVQLSSPQIYIPYDGCLSVRYYSGRYDNDNDGITALHVAVEDSSATRSLLYEFPATLGNEPIRAFVTLPRGRNVLHFSARVTVPFGESPTDVICLDDVEIHQQPCDEIRCDEAKCDEQQSLLIDPCNGNGECLGRGLKHKSCLCNLPYIGRTCEENPESSTQNPRHRWDYPYY